MGTNVRIRVIVQSFGRYSRNHKQWLQVLLRLSV